MTKTRTVHMTPFPRRLLLCFVLQIIYSIVARVSFSGQLVGSILEIAHPGVVFASWRRPSSDHETFMSSLKRNPRWANVGSEVFGRLELCVRRFFLDVHLWHRQHTR